MFKPLTPTKTTAKAESSAGPLASPGGIVTVKFWYGGFPGVDDWNCGLKSPWKSTVPNAAPGVAQGPLLHDAIPIATATLTTLVKESYKTNVSTVGRSASSIKLTGWSTSTTMLEPGVTAVPLAGEPMSILCAKQAVVRVASNAATVNFMVMITES